MSETLVEFTVEMTPQELRLVIQLVAMHKISTAQIIQKMFRIGLHDVTIQCLKKCHGEASARE